MGRIILPEQFNREENIISLGTGLEGLYSFELTKARTGKVRFKTKPQKNVITDRGLVQYWLLSHTFTPGGNLAGNCAVGTGNATPQVSDTALGSLRATAGLNTTTTGYVAKVGTVPAYWYYRANYVFAVGSATGNLTEVGVFPYGGNVNGDMASRSLILDDNGNPTSITVLSDEVLTVTWELRFYVDVADHAFNFNLNGNRIDGVYRTYHGSTPQALVVDVNSGGPAHRVEMFSSGTLADPLNGNMSGSLGFVTAAPNWIQFVNDIAVTGTCYADAGYNFPTSAAVGTIQGFTFNGHMWSYQFGQLTSPIVKTNAQQLSVNFRLVWGRFTG